MLAIKELRLSPEAYRELLSIWEELVTFEQTLARATGGQDGQGAGSWDGMLREPVV